MKRLSFLLSFLLVFVAFGFGQKKQIVDDIYVTPNDASMVQEVEAAQKAAKRTDVRASGEKPVYKNGARQIVFLDKNGRQLDFEADTVVVVDEEVMDSLANKDGYYLNGFKGSRSDLEYAERIRRFHNPKYTITIADPGYNDIYFLDDDYWNVYVDGMYATITPTWTNPYWWNYSYSPFGYNSWYWRNSIYYPFGWGGYSSYYPWYTGYGWGGYYGWGGWYDPWYSGYYGWGGYYGWDYPYYGYGYGYGYPYYGYGYGYGYPYYGYGYGGGYYYGNTYDQSGRRNVSGGRYDVNASPTNRRVTNLSGVRSASGNPYTMVTRQRAAGTDATNTVTRAGSRSAVDSRSAYAPNVSTQTRTGAVRTADQWNAARSSSTYNTGSSGRGSSTVINRSNPSVSNSSRGGEGSYSTGRSTGTYSSGSRSYDSGRSSGTYSSGSSSVSRSSSSSSGSYSGGGSSSSSGGGGRSSSSSSSGGRR